MQKCGKEDAETDVELVKELELDGKRKSFLSIFPDFLLTHPTWITITSRLPAQEASIKRSCTEKENFS